VENRVPWPFARSIFLQIPWTTERVRAQSGFFTFHATATSIEEENPKYFRKIDIPVDSIEGALKFLSSAGLNEYTVFPDFVGLAGFLRTRYRL